MPGLREEFLNDAVAVIEDAFKIAMDERDVGEFAERSQGQLVVDVVDHAGAGGIGEEGVRVAPERVGPAELDIGDAVGRSPGDDLGLPGDGQAVPVMVSRLPASAKRGKTSATERGWSEWMALLVLENGDR
jgi:hypothetical protein